MKLMNFHITTDENGRVLATVNAEVDSFVEGQHLLATVLGQHTVSEVQAAAGPRASGADAAPAARATPSAPPPEVPSYKGITDRDTLKKLAMERGLVDASNRSGAAAFVQMLEAHDRMQASQASEPVATKSAKQVVETSIPPKDVIQEEVAAERKAAVSAVQQDGSVEAPAELVGATSFRQVMNWMLANGIKTQAEIVAACEKYRSAVPAIARLSGDLSDRVGRALEVLRMEQGW